jgi:hypothetical protein
MKKSIFVALALAISSQAFAGSITVGGQYGLVFTDPS